MNIDLDTIIFLAEEECGQVINDVLLCTEYDPVWNECNINENLFERRTGEKGYSPKRVFSKYLRKAIEEEMES